MFGMCGSGRRALLRFAFLCFTYVLVTYGQARAADPWLFVNDIHLSIRSTDTQLVPDGRDTNARLFASVLGEMHRLSPHPPVIVIAGDFLDHGSHTAADAAPTIAAIARRFDRVFPRAQFVMALGNEDSDCGDYAVTPDSPFLRAVARAWEPLVNRGGAAPDFRRTFSHDGFYTARLPIHNVRAVVVDDAFWSPFYRNPCGFRANPLTDSLREVQAALAPAQNERRWLIAHIPPGIDAASTLHRARHLAIVPFLASGPRDLLVNLVSDPARHVELVSSAHVHRFAYRIISAHGAAVPVLVSPAISPIYGNNPSFLTADVASDGRIRNLEEHALVGHTWLDVGGLGTLGAAEFSGPALQAVQRRLERDPLLRDTYARLYMGAATFHEVYAGNWRSYWCAAAEMTATGFRDCLDEGGLGFLTKRGVAVVGAALVALAAIVAGFVVLIVVVVRRRRARPSA